MIFVMLLTIPCHDSLHITYVNLHSIYTALNASKEILQCTYMNYRLFSFYLCSFELGSTTATAVGCFTSFVALQTVPRFAVVLLNSVLLHFLFGAGVLTVLMKHIYSINSQVNPTYGHTLKPLMLQTASCIGFHIFHILHCTGRSSRRQAVLCGPSRCCSYHYCSGTVMGGVFPCFTLAVYQDL